MPYRSLVASILWTLLLASAAHAQAPAAGNTLQSSESTAGVPTFRTESRQVIVEAEVWEKNGGKTGKEDRSTDAAGLRGYQKGDLKSLPPPARGLAAADFHVFDNGTEQRINFFREEDFPTIDITKQWDFFPTANGIWGYSTSYAISATEPATATYFLGYVPSRLRPGECHTIQVDAEDRETVWLNRPKYCAPDANNTASKKEARLRSRMEQLLSSDARESAKAHIQASVFWSSGVLALAAETPPSPSATAQPANEFTYIAEVHDSKAPASVHIAVAFNLFPLMWNCPENGGEIHILGVAYRVRSQAAGQFEGAFTCQHWKNPVISQFLRTPLLSVPSRFDTQIDLSPGDYDLRVVVSDGTKFGQSKVPLHVEPLDPQRITISDVTVCDFLRNASWILRDTASVSPFPLNPAPLVSKNVQFFPAIDGRVRPLAPVSLYFEIYKSSLDTDGTAIYYNARVTDLKTGTLVMNTGPISAAKWVVPGNAVIPIGLNLDTKKLLKGSYRFEVQASDSAGRQSERRSTVFSIE